MALMELLARAGDVAARMGASPMPRLPGTARAAKAAAERFAEKDWRPDEATLDALADQLESPNGWAALSAADRLNCAWLLWRGERPLARRPELLAPYVKWLGEGPKPRRHAWRALIQAYLDEYAFDRPELDKAAGLIRSKVAAWRWAWADRQAQHNLFDPQLGPAALARHVLLDAPDPAAGLANFGLVGRLRRGGFAAAGFTLALSALQDYFADEASPKSDLPQRVLRWATLDSPLTYPQMRPRLAEALLVPFAQKAPPPELFGGLLAFLAIHLGDMRTAPEAWLDVNDVGQMVMSRWLAREALERYLPIVEALGHENQWGWRRAFWTAYLDCGGLVDAWLVMAEGALRSNPTLGRNGVGYGRLEPGPGVEANHAVLLMKIGGVTVADWSHNGRCYLWGPGSPAAPRLHNPTYSGRELTRDSDNKGVVHGGSEMGRWQREVASFLRDRGGVGLTDRHYMPFARR